ncbi:MAG: NAD(+) synthase [Syntrophomonadaceae bacterium]|nr:NAD(+) synthase [Syntrophomonadaceae bacterium]
MNAEAVVNHLVDWLREKVAEAGADGVVVGVSGGVDSSVAAVIAKMAFPETVLGLMLPCESEFTDMIHGQLLLEKFKIPFRIVDLDNAYHALLTKYEAYIKLDGKQGQLMRANLKPRLRMTTLYYSAQGRNLLVIGTSNKSEIYMGYATKWGDNAVDLQLLGNLTKREVYELARYLRIPSVIINKAPSAGLWIGQTDENEMGFTYDDLEAYFRQEEIDPNIAKRIEQMHKQSEHKRNAVPIPEIPAAFKD